MKLTISQRLEAHRLAIAEIRAQVETLPEASLTACIDDVDLDADNVRDDVLESLRTAMRALDDAATLLLGVP